MNSEKVQEIKILLDKNCFEEWQLKECHSQIRTSGEMVNHGRQTENCWLCIRNYKLAVSISDI
jgi:hypothetical protein